MPGTVATEIRDAVAIVTFDNPGRLNATDPAIAEGLAAAAADLKQRGDLGALILRGAGTRAFCAGVDLKCAEQSGDPSTIFSAVDKHLRAFTRDMQEMPFPTIAMLHGSCYGGGLQLAVTTDFRFVDTATKVGIPAVKSRLFYPVPAMERLQKLIGPSRLRRLFLEGLPLDAATLFAWGLFDQVEAPDELAARTWDFAMRLAAQPRDVVRVYMDMFRALDCDDAAEATRLRADAFATLSWSKRPVSP
jgi:enoyl-CoA hydratase/carnithine racemase